MVLKTRTIRSIHVRRLLHPINEYTCAIRLIVDWLTRHTIDWPVRIYNFVPPHGHKLSHNKYFYFICFAWWCSFIRTGNISNFVMVLVLGYGIFSTTICDQNNAAFWQHCPTELHLCDVGHGLVKQLPNWLTKIVNRLINKSINKTHDKCSHCCCSADSSWSCHKLSRQGNYGRGDMFPRHRRLLKLLINQSIKTDRMCSQRTGSSYLRRTVAPARCIHHSRTDCPPLSINQSIINQSIPPTTNCPDIARKAASIWADIARGTQTTGARTDRGGGYMIRGLL